MSIRIIQADVMAGLAAIEDQSVQCCVTSPPYWGLRDYGVDGQIGLEKTPEEYVNKMVEVFGEVRRVLRDDGTLWLNIGDCYFGSNNTDKGGNENFGSKAGISNASQIKENYRGLNPKNLIGIPWRVAFALQADGWYLRSDIIWHKPNPMPSSVTDRPTSCHEHIFLLTKKAKYFYDGEAIREPASDSYIKDKRPKGVLTERVNKNSKYHALGGQYRKQDHTGNPTYTGFNERWLESGRGQKPSYNNSVQHGQNSLEITRNKRDVWTITTQARPECHFATFPDALVEPCILAGTSERGCCPECGAPYNRIIEVTGGTIGKSWHPHANDAATGQIAGMSMEGYKRESKGWQPSCTCNAGDPVPCVVLDPFGGSGTVAKVARALLRDSVLIEINPVYVEIMKNGLRLNEQLFDDSRIEVIA